MGVGVMTECRRGGGDPSGRLAGCRREDGSDRGMPYSWPNCWFTRPLSLPPVVPTLYCLRSKKGFRGQICRCFSVDADSV